MEGIIGNASYPNVPPHEPEGIYITSIVAPDSGWPIAVHCKYCRKTVIVHSPYSFKPEDGDYWLVQGCADEEETHHGMREAIAALRRPLDPLRGMHTSDW